MSDEMAKVQRFSRTEKAIRAMDATDIVEMVHAMEDERDALRAALDAAEKDSDAWRKSNWALLTERDAALAARDAAWRAALNAAADYVDECFAELGIMLGTASIRALQPPADLAAEAPGDAVAKEREACAEIAETVMRDADENCRANRFGGYTHSEAAAAQAAQEIAAAIRARAGA